MLACTVLLLLVDFDWFWWRIESADAGALSEKSFYETTLLTVGIRRSVAGNVKWRGVDRKGVEAKGKSEGSDDDKVSICDDPVDMAMQKKSSLVETIIPQVLRSFMRPP